MSRVNPLLGELTEGIEAIQRQHLLQTVPPRPNFSGILSALRFVRVAGSANIVRSDSALDVAPRTLLDELLFALHGYGSTVAFVLASKRSELRVLMGVDPTSASTDDLKASLTGLIGEVSLAGARTGDIASMLDGLPSCAAVTGIPSQTISDPHSIIQRMTRAMAHSQDWAYVMLAHSEEESTATSLHKATSDELRRVVSTYSPAGREANDRPAQHYCDLLEAWLSHLATGQRTGLWRTSAYLLSAETDLPRLMGIIRANLAGPDSTPEPVRIRVCGTGRSSQPAAAASSIRPDTESETIMSSMLVGRLIGFPSEELNGFKLLEAPAFDVDYDRPKSSRLISLGSIVENGSSSGRSLSVDLDTLTRHCLIVGTTGSGKSNTCLSLLKQCWADHRVPFLVIEPAKAEYRSLLADPSFEAALVFTLGEETGVPFRMNPFEVDPGVSVQKHIDHLSALFNASFVMYAPMPYILEESLREIYVDKGWAPVVNANIRGSGPQSFPTLSDLAQKIDEVVDRLGYEQRITMDVKAGLRARLNTMRAGSRGAMLDTRESVPFGELMDRPVILELTHIGDDEQKAFLIGLILLRINEHWERFGPPAASGLQHITVIEEAHRLLQNVNLVAGTDTASPKAKAIETFSNLMSEIRAYGEGIIIVEQIPSKLAIDAIKNTSTKIVHRTLAEDDRELVGGSMNMTSEQRRFVLQLPPGRAALHTEGLDRPHLVEFPFIKNPATNPLSINDVRSLVAPRLKAAGLSSSTDTDAGLGSLRDLLARRAAGDPGVRDYFRRCMVTFLEGSEPAGMQAYLDFVDALRAWAPPLPVKKHDELRTSVRRLLSDGEAERLGRLYSWPFDDETRWHAVLREAVDAQEAVRADTASDPALMEARNRLRGIYGELTSFAARPFTACSPCASVCRFRYFADAEIDSNVVADFLDVLKAEALDDSDRWREFGRLVTQGASRLMRADQLADLEPVAICYAVHVANRLFRGREQQERFVFNVQRVLKESSEKA